MFVIFIIYGSMIIMNLLVAVANDRYSASDAESVLLESRIEDMSGMTQMNSVFFNWLRTGKQKQQRLPNFPQKVFSIYENLR